jgi:UDP-N-acetylmuramoyl-tripeptide--D-alanyl-D-alanine ligase
MKPISLQQALLWIRHATLHTKHYTWEKRSTSYGVNTDTRTLRSGQLFVALQGDRFDGHRFIGLAARHGAAAAVVAFDSPELNAQDAGDMPLLRVPHTGKALQELAAGYRQQFQIPLTVIVGSNGKTTAKEMIHSIFKAHCATMGNERATHCTVGNFNNEIGLPLTLLRLNDYHRYSTVELGMNHPGETAVLAAIAAPTIALINNAQREHQEFMQTVEAVALEHSAVIAALSQDGIAVIPAQDAYVAVWRHAAKAASKRVIDFALNSGIDTTPAAITGTRIEHGLSQTLHVQTPQGATTIALNTAGEHNARNALAAIAVATAAGIPLASIVAGLESFSPVKGRMQQHTATVNGAAITVIDDSYNANPDSVAAAIRVLAPLGKRSVLILGDMGEVGDQGAAFHTEAGADASAQGVAALYTLGDLCKHAYTAFKASGKPCQHFADAVAMNAFLTGGALQAGSTVLVKGSRFMRMEMTVDALLGMSPSAVGGH